MEFVQEMHALAQTQRSARPSVAAIVALLAGVSASVVIVEPAPIDLLLVGLSGWWLIRERLELPRTSVVLGLVYVSMSAISQVIAGLNGVVFDATVARDLAVETYLVVVLICLTARFATDTAFLRSFTRGIVAGAILLSMGYLALRLVGSVPDILYRDQFRTRVSGLFKDPNVLGPFLVLPILLLGFRNEVVQFRFSRIAALPCVLLLAVTYSRGAYIALFVALGAVSVLIAMRERLTHVGVIGTLTTLAMLCTIVVATWSSINVPEVEIDTSRLSYQSYDDDRFSDLASATTYIMAHPFGNGSRQFGVEHGNNPHNLFLGKATDAGLIAGVIVVVVPMVAAWRALRTQHPRFPRFTMLVGAALLGNLAVSTVIYSHHWRHLFFLVATSLALTRVGRRDELIDLTSSPDTRKLYA